MATRTEAVEIVVLGYVAVDSAISTRTLAAVSGANRTNA